MLANKKNPFQKVVLPEYLYKQREDSDEKFNTKNDVLKVDQEITKKEITENKDLSLDKKPALKEDLIKDNLREVKDPVFQFNSKGKEVKYVEIIIKDEKLENEKNDLINKNLKSEENVETFFEKNYFEPNQVFSKIDSSFENIIKNENSDISNNKYFNNPEKREQTIKKLKRVENKTSPEIHEAEFDIGEKRKSLNEKITGLKQKLGVDLNYKNENNLENELKDNLHVEKYIEKPQKVFKSLDKIDLKKLNLYDLIIYLNKIDTNKLNNENKEKILNCIDFKISYIRNLIDKYNDKKIIVAANNVVNALVRTLQKMQKKRDFNF